MTGWIDLNKNGKKDVYEDPTQPGKSGIDDFNFANDAGRKTCQLATLYGYKRVLKDYLPTKEWCTGLVERWCGNIDEELTGYPTSNLMRPAFAYIWPPSNTSGPQRSAAFFH